MRGAIGVPTEIRYSTPYVGKRVYRLSLVERLKDLAKNRYKAINLYASGKYTIEQICEIFEIDRSTFYRWMKKYKNGKILYILEPKGVIIA
jgi:transposase-like protein